MFDVPQQEDCAMCTRCAHVSFLSKERCFNVDGFSFSCRGIYVLLKINFMSIRLFILSVFFVFSGFFCTAVPPSIIPVPVEMKQLPGQFTLTRETSVSVLSKDQQVKRLGDYLSKKISIATGFNIVAGGTSKKNVIVLHLNEKPDGKIGKEGYALKVTENGVVVSANQPAGLFYGIQTLLQLLPKEISSRNKTENVKWVIEGIEITDYPRFSYRGIMLDVSRHFFSKEYMKEYIDQLAQFKYNRLHWHLTDDNGWRVEIKSLPKLTSVGAWRVPRTGTFGSNEAPKPGEAPTYGGFYTQEDIKEIVQFAKERYIEILPEIDVPGHSMAALAAYPELSVSKDTTTKVNPGTKFSTWYGNGKFTMHIDNTLNPTDEKVYDFLDKVITELAALFPYEYIHMGGDECYKGFWERDPKVQEFMKKNKIKNGEELQAYFTARVSKIVSSKKKKLIGWDEILEGGIPADAAVMSWRGTKGGIEATTHKHMVVMSPSHEYYLDMIQGDPSIEAPVYSSARLKEVYNFSILPAGIDSTYVLGGQGNLWTEQVPTVPQLEYMMYPRALAISETLWSQKGKKNWNNFVERVENQFARFDLAKINYSVSLYDPIILVKKNASENLVIELTTEKEGIDLYYTLDNAVPNQYHTKYSGPITLTEDVDNFRVISYQNGKPLGRLISLKKEDLVKRVKK
jgi:hexosaminidase